LTILLLFLGTALAVAETRLPQAQEDRARVLFTELRCVVCQNQSIADSEADVARDLREIVRQEISTGKSDSEIRAFLVARYGEFILLKPDFAWHTFLLWAAPVLLLLIGALILLLASRRPVDLSVNDLSEEEEKRLAALLGEQDQQP